METATVLGVPTLPPLAFNSIPVLTTELLAQAYEVEPHQIRQNFKNNRDRFIEGKHYFSLAGEELKGFKNCVENFYSVEIDKHARNLILWTERGCARHAKSLNTDRAWDMFELLEETFFAVAKSSQNQYTSSNSELPPSDQNIIQTLVKAIADRYPEAERKSVYMQIWMRFRNHFRIGSYKQLPQSKMGEAVAYLANFRVNEKKRLNGKAMAAIDPAMREDLQKALLALEDMQQACDYHIEHINAYLQSSALHYESDEQKRRLFHTLQHVRNAAQDGLYMARNSLAAAWNLGRGVSFI